MRWERLGDRSSRWTTGRRRGAPWSFLILLTLAHVALALALPPAEDELYYWVWSTRLQGSYFDHPPLVAYLIRLSTSLFGDNRLGIRFFPIVFSTVIVWLIGRMSQSQWVPIAVGLTPLGLVLGLVMTPDVPLLLFWLLYAVWAANLNRIYADWRGDPMQRVYRSTPASPALWALGGLLLGLGFLGKYTMALAPLCLALLLAFNYRWRSWVGGFLVHVGVAALVSLPVVLFNFRHEMAPFAFQWTHAMGPGTRPAFGEFLLAQVALVGGLPLMLLPWVFALRARLCAVPLLQVCYYFFLPPFLFFLYKATQSRLEGNWGLVAYLTFWPLARTLFDDNSFKSAGRVFLGVALLPTMAASTLLVVHTIRPLSFVPPEWDRIALLEEKLAVASTLADHMARLDPEAVIWAPTYQWTSYFRYLGRPAEQIPTGRMTHYTLEPRDPCAERRAVVLVENDAPDGYLACLPRRETLVSVPLVVRGKPRAKVELWLFGKEEVTATSE